MADIEFGGAGEVVIYGLDEQGLGDVHNQLKDRGINLADPEGLVSRIGAVRGIGDHEVGGWEWGIDVDHLSREVAGTERAIKEADLSRYTLNRMGIVLPNPAYRSSVRVAQGGMSEDTINVARSYSGARKYEFLTKEALSGLAVPEARWRLDHLAVAVLFGEPDRESSGRSRPYSY